MWLWDNMNSLIFYGNVHWKLNFSKLSLIKLWETEDSSATDAPTLLKIVKVRTGYIKRIYACKGIIFLITTLCFDNTFVLHSWHYRPKEC